jgi:hypothetical protein
MLFEQLRLKDEADDKRAENYKRPLRKLIGTDSGGVK